MMIRVMSILVVGDYHAGHDNGDDGHDHDPGNDDDDHGNGDDHHQDLLHEAPGFAQQLLLLLWIN